MTKRRPVTVEKCLCGHSGCSTWWLAGIGRFVQGIGFTEIEARDLALAYNTMFAESFKVSPAVKAECMRLIGLNKPLLAIGHLRENTGFGLLLAKDLLLAWRESAK